jgi:hypothetical protein
MSHGIRAAVAQKVYHEIKYGDLSHDEVSPEKVARKSEYSYSLYPFNFNLCIWTAEKAYYNRFDEKGRIMPERLELARLWCERALELNRYRSQIRLLKAHLLAETSLPKAITYWEKYVNWHFWKPHNHVVLVEMYSDNGDFGKALDSLQWVRGSRHYDYARKRLQDAWDREKQPPAFR